MGLRRTRIAQSQARHEPGDIGFGRPKAHRNLGLGPSSGFSLIELMVVVGIGTILIGAAVPSVLAARQRMELSGATHDVAAAVQGARMRAVTSGVTMRLRFNCPAAGQFRVVEVVGVAWIDGATNRCDPAAYPYPDMDSTTRPNFDGPVLVLRGGTTFSQVVTFDIAPSGRITPATGAMPVSIVVARGSATQTVTITASGRVAFQ